MTCSRRRGRGRDPTRQRTRWESRWGLWGGGGWKRWGGSVVRERWGGLGKRGTGSGGMRPEQQPAPAPVPSSMAAAAGRAHRQAVGSRRLGRFKVGGPCGPRRALWLTEQPGGLDRRGEKAALCTKLPRSTTHALNLCLPLAPALWCVLRAGRHCTTLHHSAQVLSSASTAPQYRIGTGNRFGHGTKLFKDEYMTPAAGAWRWGGLCVWGGVEGALKVGERVGGGRRWGAVEGAGCMGRGC